MAANFRVGKITWIFHTACSTKIRSNVTSFRGITWRRGKYHHQHMNAECHCRNSYRRARFGPSYATRARRHTCPNGAAYRWASFIPECFDHSVSAYIGQVKSSQVKSGGKVVGGQLKYSSLVSMETTQGICFFSLKRGSSDQDSKLVATM